ncbi:MAG TPA: VIT and VWA domain-containing protein, partial [Thermoanaerobaculia bacterium]|nr:VIT and VWA domain-containing protein [Thermoanaerobaculia bacterium]
MKRAVPLLLLLGAFPASAQTGLLVPTSTGRPDPRVLSLREMTVDVGVARGVARVNVRQIFENHTGEVQEGTWRFRLSPSGAVGDFAVWDGLVRIPGVIVEKKRARAIYEELTTRRIDPGLLQQGEEEDSAGSGQRPSGGAVFSVKVAPIPAWGTKRLEMQYQEEVPWADGVGEIRIPLRPGEGEPTSAGSLEVTVTLEDGAFLAPPASALPLTVAGKTARFRASDVPLAKDVVIRIRPSSSAPLAFSAFRSPDGRLPDGLALAPWERLSDVPPEKDGFFLLEHRPAALAAAPGAGAPASRAPLSVALLFDTSLSTRWGSLETGWAFVNRLLARLGPADRLVAVPFDRAPAPDPAGLLPATDAAKTAALTWLRSRLLAPGTETAAAVRAAASLLPNDASARLVLVTDGVEAPGDLAKAAQGRPLFTVLTGDERREIFPASSRQILPLPPGSASQPPAGEALFLAQLLADLPREEAKARTKVDLPFAVKGPDPKLRDVYGVLTQPPLAGSLSGWVGRYAQPAKTTIELASATVPADFPDRALEARDLPRRWARARVDDLLRRIELEGEKREWVEEILELSRRYKFVTPYTAFLAAPRSLLRPRRIQPGDPILRIEALPGTAAVAALLPFGRKLDLTRRPSSNLWEGRFLVPEDTTDGPMNVRIVLRDQGGATAVENKRVVVDGTPPTITPVIPAGAAAGSSVTLAARADADVIVLTARVGDGLPVPLRWDGAAKANTGELLLPQGITGSVPVLFEAI